MNAIQFYNAISLYINETHTSRFYFSEVNKAMNDAILKKVYSITDAVKEGSGIDRVQKFRDELYTLMAKSTISVTNVSTINDNVKEDHINFPTDYQTFARLSLTINSNTTYARDTTYGQLGPLLECSFRIPSNKKPYFLEDSTGLLIYRGTSSTISNATLYYVKAPATYNMGTESQIINYGAGVLAINTTYIAYEVSVYNSITYKEGDEFTTNGVLTDLTSGAVILKSNTTTCDLPEKSHPEIAKMAAEILLGTISAFDNSAFAQKEAGSN